MTGVKNKCERIMSNSLKSAGLWYLKLQNNLLCHTPNPADFIVQNHDGDIILIECKQIMKEQGKFYFQKLTQLMLLEAFRDYHESNRSFLCLYFLGENYKDSMMFMIPLHVIEALIDEEKKSLSISDCIYLGEVVQLKFLDANTVDLECLL